MVLRRTVRNIYSDGFVALAVCGSFVIWLVLHERVSRSSAIVFWGLALLVGLLEWKAPARAEWRRRRSLRDFAADGFYLLGLLFVWPLLWGPPLNKILEPLSRLTTHLHWWPTSWPLAARALLAVIVGEFFAYSFHRAEHRFEFLWRLHSTHHSPNHMAMSKFAINHPVELFVIFLVAAIPALFGASGLDIEGGMVVTMASTLVAHANLPLRSSWTKYLFISPLYHQRHHSVVVSESSSNFGCTTVFWDLIFRTYVVPSGEFTVGIEPRKELGLVEQLILPFRASAVGTTVMEGKKPLPSSATTRA